MRCRLTLRETKCAKKRSLEESHNQNAGEDGSTSVHSLTSMRNYSVGDSKALSIQKVAAASTHFWCHDRISPRDFSAARF